ncbi:MAG: hypothetical protein KJ954_14425 [Alphaproteobacteria bacterium]|nr:hypothetical protein [Alphaproteobacteria bacterium]
MIEKNKGGRPRIDRSDPLAAQRDRIINQLYKDAIDLDKTAQDSPTSENIDRAFKVKMALMPYLAGKAKDKQEKEAKFSPEQWLELASILQEMFPQLPLPAGVQEKNGEEMVSVPKETC